MPRLDRNEEAQRKKEKMTWLMTVPRLNACSTCKFLLSPIFEVIQLTMSGAEDSLSRYGVQTSFLRRCKKNNEEKRSFE